MRLHCLPRLLALHLAAYRVIYLRQFGLSGRHGFPRQKIWYRQFWTILDNFIEGGGKQRQSFKGYSAILYSSN